jgi:hypothetical protein
MIFFGLGLGGPSRVVFRFVTFVLDGLDTYFTTKRLYWF